MKSFQVSKKKITFVEISYCQLRLLINIQSKLTRHKSVSFYDVQVFGKMVCMVYYNT